MNQAAEEEGCSGFVRQFLEMSDLSFPSQDEGLSSDHLGEIGHGCSPEAGRMVHCSTAERKHSEAVPRTHLCFLVGEMEIAKPLIRQTWQL